MLRIGSQYYRPPFPVSSYWDDDFAAMKDAGLNTVQLWVVWSWVESEPEHYRFDDYDALLEKAAANGLGVILSTIAAVHPYWIHRVEPGSEMVTNFGQKVVSSNRAEIHFGLTPGGCIDHPGVIARMRGFLSAAAERYKDHPAVVGWDAWNELRWNIHADGLVCYCEHTLREYRGWLDRTYGGLAGLNDAWMRRYVSWEDVYPGKVPNRPYTDMMAFSHFITERSNNHALFRYRTIKDIVGSVDVTVHGGMPTVLYAAGEYPIQTPLARGNDWVLAQTIDGIGCSSFPLSASGATDPVDLHNRFEYLRSASGNAKIWLSELQGGRYNSGFAVGTDVDAVRQQRWIWNGIAIGADTILLWCWRDEVFGREAGGFGFAGSDGHYADRAAAMRKARQVIDSHQAVFDGYRADRARIGVLFSPQSHYLMWAEEGTARKCLDALEGYTHALTRLGYDYDIIEEDHLDRLDHYRVLLLPRVCVLSDDTTGALLGWVNGGGRLITESETGAFSSAGIYRYPDRRPFGRAGIRETARRPLDRTLDIHSAAGRFEIVGDSWRTPLLDSCGLAGDSVDVAYGKGSILMVGTYPGNAYRSQIRAGGEHDEASSFEGWLAAEFAAAGLSPIVRTRRDNPGRFPAFARVGTSPSGRLVFVFATEAASADELVLDPVRVPPGRWYEIITGAEVTVQRDGVCAVPASPWGVVVFYRDHPEGSDE